ncbi:hypothetical protein TRIUR3_11442 [Triticum urartu]|uniref:Uncharacterized protein n=1 Tax=Triticum urartu TaxID=4572 RepID=M8AHY4_TRIUA|nr:hypothetical protein TRIUR3_11442 [Triticum urartu]
MPNSTIGSIPMTQPMGLERDPCPNPPGNPTQSGNNRHRLLDAIFREKCLYKMRRFCPILTTPFIP